MNYDCVSVEDNKGSIKWLKISWEVVTVVEVVEADVKGRLK